MMDETHTLRYFGIRFDFLLARTSKFRVDEERTQRTRGKKHNAKRDTRIAPITETRRRRGEGTAGYRGCAARCTSSNRLLTGIIAHPPSFGVSFSKLTNKTLAPREKCEVRYFNRKQNLFLRIRYVTFYTIAFANEKKKKYL